MDIVFMGTPDFAVPALEALMQSGECVKAVFTQPDKPKGRGYKLVAPPVKEFALLHNIPAYQPSSLKSGAGAEDALNALKEISPDLIIVAAYGKILPKAVLELPRLGCVNIHASLLPKYRGAAPIQRCIINGEHETGITLMHMDEGLDTGGMLTQKSVGIGENETASELHDKLSALGAELLIETLPLIKAGKITPQSQDESLSSYAQMIDKSMCALDFSKPAHEVHNMIRGLSEHPGAYLMLNGKRIKIYKSAIEKETTYSDPAGTIADAKNFSIVCGNGKAVRLNEVQPEGGKRLKTEDYIRGNPLSDGQKISY